MPKAKLHAALVGSADDTEAAFYEALQKGDVEQLMACWADDDEIICVHPGGPRLVGPATIRSAFEHMFADGGSVRVRPERVRKIESLSSVVHNLLERVEVRTDGGERVAYVLATNVYHKTAQGWRLVMHHASPGTLREMPEADFAPQTLH